METSAPVHTPRGKVHTFKHLGVVIAVSQRCNGHDLRDSHEAEHAVVLHLAHVLQALWYVVKGIADLRVERAGDWQTPLTIGIRRVL